MLCVMGVVNLGLDEIVYVFVGNVSSKLIEVILGGICYLFVFRCIWFVVNVLANIYLN